MQDLIHKAADLPWAGLLPVGAVFLLGLILWVAGRPVLRPVFTAIGLIVGGLIGVEIGVLPRVADVGAPLWAFGVAGAVVAALLAALAYRLLLAVAICSLFGALAPLLVWTAVELNVLQIEGDQSPSVQEILARPQDPGDVAAPGASPEAESRIEPAPSAEPALATASEEVPGDNVPPQGASASAPAEWKRWATETVGFVRQRGEAAWEQSAGPLRWTLFAAAAVGALLGLVVGASAPSFSASVVTALGGSLLLIGAGCTAAARLHLPAALLPESAIAWLVWWIVAAVIGLGLQWIFRPKPADK